MAIIIGSLFENTVVQKVDRELRKVEIILISYYRNGDFYINF